LNLKRKSPLRPSENRKRKRKKAAWQPGEKYSGDSYRGIIIAACKAAEVKPWNPNQLRHTAGTEIATLYDDKTASAVLGHSDPKTTKAYIDQARELRIAREVMLKIG
jgi:integrase